MCLCRYVTVAVASKCSCDTEDRRTVMVEQPLIYSDINNRPCPRVTRGRIDGVRLIFLSICRHVPTLTVICSTFLHHSLALDCLLLCDLCSEFPRNSEIMGQPDLGPKCGIMRVRTSLFMCLHDSHRVFCTDFSQTLQKTFLIGIKSPRALTTFIKRIKTGLETFYFRSTNCKPTLY